MEDSPGQDSKQRVTAIAEYDYFAKEDDEIDLLKGQIIQNITQKPGGWWEGTISSTGKRGMFPDNFVRVIENAENNMVVLREKSSSAQRRCKAIYSYTQVNEDELSLAVGDIIDFLTEVEEGWWRGKLNNKVGVFPSNFVVSIPTSPIFASQRPNFSEDSKATKSKAKKASNTINRDQTVAEENAISNKIIDTVLDKSVDDYRAPDLPPRPIKEFCRVEFPYSPQNDDELELNIGQIITIVDKELPDKGWWKGEVNGKIGVFPDNFVKLLPMDVALEKDTRTQQSKTVAKETSKKTINSIIPPISPPKGFESRDLNEEFSNKTNIQSGNIAAQRMSLENINSEHVTQSSSSDRTNRNSGLKTADTKKNIENFDEKKAPPPLPNKKPSIPVKKTITNVAGNMLSGLRQKVKNVEQKTSLSQDANDGGHSSKLNNDTRTNIERTSSFDEILGGDSEFDKVQRASILSDMRAGRVKAPKRRPPSVSTNLMTESIIKSMNLNNENDDVFDESETVSSTNNEELVKPKSIEYGAQKVPWMDELKASQIKIKSLPFIEPRTTLVNINNEIKIEEEKPIASVISNVSTKIINTESDVSLLKENIEAKSSISYYQSSSSSSSEKNIKSEAEISKPTSDITINKELIKDKFEDIDEINPPKSLHSKINVMRMKSEKTKSTSSHVVIQSNETPDSVTQTQEGKTIIELGKRVQKLESCVQMQQELIEDLRKMLQNESNRVELLKNQLDKYAQCVTQV